MNIDDESANYIINKMSPHLDSNQMAILEYALEELIRGKRVMPKMSSYELLYKYLQSKQVEGCSDRSIELYGNNILMMLKNLKKHVYSLTTEDIRNYLTWYKDTRQVAPVTLESIRISLAGFFKWLKLEGYILRDPMEKIHSIKLQTQVKEPYTDEELEMLRDHCKSPRNLAMIDLLVSTGMRVGELVNLNISDINFEERECIVLGKGNKERVVYFDAKAKVHLLKYLETRKDDNPALFVSKGSPHERLTKWGVDRMLNDLGKECGISEAYAHKFRRTMATSAIDRGMPIEQVQKLLGHAKINTTLRYAMVNQSGLKSAHRKYLG